MKDLIFEQIKEAMFEYEDSKVQRLVEETIKNDMDPLKTADVLIESITDIGNRFQTGELFLPDLILGAKTMAAGMSILEDKIRKEGLERKSSGKVIIGTVKGDLHDIGKKMVATLLTANGFDVIDLGIDVNADTFTSEIAKQKPDILAMSSLLTTTAAEQKRVITSLEENDLRGSVKIMVGGGAITEEFAQKIGADGYEPTAVLAVSLAKGLIKKG